MKGINHRHRLVVALITLLVTLGFAATAYAHGVVITYSLKTNGEVELYAEFDTGEAMAEAQVTIYSPEDPLTPWLVGTADAEGRYVFVIDPELVGLWDIQYRKAGHGDIVHLQLEEGMINPTLVVNPPGELALTPPVIDQASDTEPGQMVHTTQDATADQLETAPSEASAAEPETKPDTKSVTAAQAETAVEAAPVGNVAETETVAQVDPEAVNLPVETGQVAVISSGGNTATTGGFTSLQILLMSASVIWGFVGTALYFSSKRTQDHSHGHAHGHHH